ncbi:MAG: dihydroorotase [Planctomycetota bacterium]|jgi:dihydroorotase|nr:dihydroorotase [Planctomycetota bacterium]
MTILIRGGRVFDPARKIDRVGDLYIENGKIVKRCSVEETIDAKGLVVVPGLIDMHVHLREPGREDKETIASGSASALAGGFTSVACMANNGQPTDTHVQVGFIKARAAEVGGANIFPIGAVSKQLKGEELAEMGTMAAEGAVAFSDDGFAIMNAGLMRRALEYSRMFGKAVIAHCEDTNLSHGAIMNEGSVSTELGLPGYPNVAEAAMAARDIMLSELTGGHVHIAHVSTRQTVDVVREAKRKKLRVTAEVAPHHLLLTDESLRGYDSRFKMSPPLRTDEDVLALRKALADGTIDVIASDHAPHTTDEKERQFDACPNGVVGLETTVGVILNLVADRKLTLKRAIEAMTIRPAQILGIKKGTLANGADADITLLDPKKKWKVDPSRFLSKGKSTPFTGMTFQGKAVQTIVGGRVCS